MDDNAAALPNLLLRPGSVGNDILSNPAMPGTIYSSVTNFAVTTTNTNILTKLVPVPDGFTIAHVSVIGRVFAINNTAGLDYLYGETNIAGLNGWSLPLAVSDSGGSGTNVSAFSTILPDLTPGGSVSIQLAAHTAFGSWAADAVNTAEVSGSITWYR